MDGRIPTDVWMDVVLHLLDARDLVVLAEARLLPAAALWPKGAAFGAKRVLSAAELAWFTERRIPVSLLPVECLTDQIYLPDAYQTEHGLYLMHAPRFPKHQWTLKSTGILHRDYNLPAVEWNEDGTRKEWWHDGKLHRDGDAPAFESEVCKIWYVHGKIHRDGDRPAIVCANGDREFWVNGERHRDGLPAIERANGDREFWVNGERHRDGGLPAVERGNGDREFWVNGKKHRWWGPALVWSDGVGGWYWHGVSFHRASRVLFVSMYATGLVGMSAGLVQGCTPSFWLDMAVGAAICGAAHFWGGTVCVKVLALPQTQDNVLAVCAALNAIGVALVITAAAAVVRHFAPR
jgi:hypothetical protein